MMLMWDTPLDGLKVMPFDSPKSITTSKSMVMPVCMTGEENISIGPGVDLIIGIWLA